MERVVRSTATGIQRPLPWFWLERTTISLGTVPGDFDCPMNVARMRSVEYGRGHAHQFTHLCASWRESAFTRPGQNRPVPFSVPRTRGCLSPAVRKSQDGQSRLFPSLRQRVGQGNLRETENQMYGMSASNVVGHILQSIFRSAARRQQTYV